MDDNFNYEQFADRLIGELKAQVDALVAELAQKQEMVERARIEGQREIIQEIEDALNNEDRMQWRIAAIAQVLSDWHDIND